MNPRDDYDFERIFSSNELAQVMANLTPDIIQANMRELASDPKLAYIQSYSQALVTEGVEWDWDPESPIGTARRFGGGGLVVPVSIEFLDEVRESGAPPEAVACYTKAATYWSNFMLGEDNRD